MTPREKEQDAALRDKTDGAYRMMNLSHMMKGDEWNYVERKLLDLGMIKQGLVPSGRNPELVRTTFVVTKAGRAAFERNNK